MPRFHCLPKIKKLFRIIEIFLILVFLTSASIRLPFAIKITGEYFRQLISVVVSPLFIFLLGNVIVLSLFLKSRHLFPQDEHSQISIETHLEICQEFITNRDDCTHFTLESFLQPEEVVFQDKQTIFEVTKVKALKRSQSENLRRGKGLEEDNCSSCGKQLQRSETEKLRRVADGGEVALEAVEMVDELSNEEFQSAIEAFIAKQIKFHQQEKLAIVLHGRT
ncbi:hypothetical protein Pfo_018598 [Paulownia fortunei]|nr:hypothetical protein Pfo_018598 [Paulownia fortunei]